MTESSLKEEKDRLNGNQTEVFALYGPEHHKGGSHSNTGVMFISASKFMNALPHIEKFAVQHSFNFPAYDQGLLNAYFSQEGHRKYVADLQSAWNYKAYWGQKDDDVVRLVHFHGPKPGRLLECLASMDQWSHFCDRNHSRWKDYQPLIDMGFAADGGFLANQTMKHWNEFSLSSTPQL